MEIYFLLTLLSVATYIYGAVCLQLIARKTNTEDGWFAWVPIANIYLMCKIARTPAWWVLLFFIPIVNIAIIVIIWMKIAETLNKPSWLGIITLIPLVGFVAQGYLAFGQTGDIRTDIKAEETKNIKSKKGAPFLIIWWLIITPSVIGVISYFILSIEMPSEDDIVKQSGLSKKELKEINTKLDILKEPLFQSLTSILPPDFPIIKEKMGRPNPFGPIK